MQIAVVVDFAGGFDFVFTSFVFNTLRRFMVVQLAMAPPPLLGRLGGAGRSGLAVACAAVLLRSTRLARS